MKLKNCLLPVLVVFSFAINIIFLFKLTANHTDIFLVKTLAVKTSAKNSSLQRLVKSKRSLYNGMDSQDIVNPFVNYTYTLRPKDDFCGRDSGKDLLFIAFVPVSPKKIEYRSVVRTTWGQHQAAFNFKVVFLAGHDDKCTYANKMIKEESEIYGDIVQANFSDTYFNLTTKTMMGFRWVSTYCGNAKYTLKIDDDMVVSVKDLTGYLNALIKNNTHRTNSFLCKYYWRSYVYRDKRSKFYLSKEEHPQNYFDPYCDGQAYILTTELTGKMFDVSLHVKQMKFEDVYIGVIYFFNDN